MDAVALAHEIVARFRSKPRMLLLAGATFAERVNGGEAAFHDGLELIWAAYRAATTPVEFGARGE